MMLILCLEVVLVTRLEHVSTGHHVTVANLHTIWENFSQLDVASLHVALVLHLLQGEEGALLVTGDFNSLPEMEPYLLLTQGGLTEEQLQEEQNSLHPLHHFALLLQKCLHHSALILKEPLAPLHPTSHCTTCKTQLSYPHNCLHHSVQLLHTLR